MKATETDKNVTIDHSHASTRMLFGGPLTLRTSFILTVLFDFSLLVIAGTIASVIWGF